MCNGDGALVVKHTLMANRFKHYILVGLTMYLLLTIYFLNDVKVGSDNEAIDYIEWMELRQGEKGNDNAHKSTHITGEIYPERPDEILRSKHERNVEFGSKAIAFKKRQFLRKFFNEVANTTWVLLNLSSLEGRIIQNNEKDLNRHDVYSGKTSIPGFKSSISTMTSTLKVKPVDRSILQKKSYNFQKVGDELYLYSAYYDDRQFFKERNSRFVRMIILGDSILTKTRQMYCYFKKNMQNFNITTKVSFYETCENHMKKQSSFVVSCTVPDEISYENMIHDGFAISVEKRKAKPNFNSNTFYKIHVLNNKYDNPGRTGNFSVCIPPLFGNISPHYLIEFVELSRILGAEHFTFYTQDIGSKAMDVLTAYEGIKVATVMPWPLKMTENDVWYHGQSASVWDCLHRNMDRFKYVAFNDIDEFIVPKLQLTWGDLTKQLEEEDGIDTSILAGYRFQSAFFESKNPNADVATLNILKTKRSKMLSRLRTKLLVNPLKVFEIGIHHLSKPMQEEFVTRDVRPEIAFLHHYRKCDTNWGMNCNEMVEDRSMNKYKNKLLQNIKLILEHMKSQNIHFPENVLNID